MLINRSPGGGDPHAHTDGARRSSGGDSRGAGRLFAECGYATVSASDVARHAGPASYMGGKRGLFIMLVERLGPQIIEVIRLDTSRTVRVRARSLATLVARLDRREPADLAGDGRPE